MFRNSRQFIIESLILLFDLLFVIVKMHFLAMQIKLIVVVVVVASSGILLFTSANV